MIVMITNYDKKMFMLNNDKSVLKIISLTIINLFPFTVVVKIVQPIRKNFAVFFV